MWNNLMNNSFVGFLFGAVMTLLGYFGLADIWFAVIFGAIFVIAKEIVNSQMLDNPVNDKVAVFGLIGCALAVLGIALL